MYIFICKVYGEFKVMGVRIVICLFVCDLKCLSDLRRTVTDKKREREEEGKTSKRIDTRIN